jgi:hypothetical protein
VTIILLMRSLAVQRWRSLAVAAIVSMTIGFGLGLKGVWIFVNRPCPPAYDAQPVGLIDGIWRCLPQGVEPPAGDVAWWNSLPTAHRNEEVGVYLANVRVRLFSYSNNGGYHFVGLNVPAPPY